MGVCMQYKWYEMANINSVWSASGMYKYWSYIYLQIYALVPKEAEY